MNRTNPVVGLTVPVGSAVSPGGAQGIEGAVGEALPIGTMLPFSGELLPDSFLWCDGASYPRVLYPELAEVLGTVFGGDANNFNVPDCRGRVLAGAGANSWVRGGKYGAYTHQLIVAELASHTHIQDAHSHNFAWPGWLPNQTDYGATMVNQWSGWGGRMNSVVATNQNTGGNGAHNNVQPTLGAAFIIKAERLGRIGVSEAAVVPECGRLTIDGASPSATLKFLPYKGNQIRIGGRLYQIPAAGVSSGHADVYVNGVSGQTLVGGTLYYIYLFDDGGTLKFDFSTTGHVTGTDGVEIKNGDETRALVGLLQTGGSVSAGFYDQATFRFIRSWFNRPRVQGYNVSGAGFTATPTIQGVCPISFVCFEGETVLAIGQAYFTGNPTANIFFACGLDGVSALGSGVSTFHMTSAYENVAPVASWSPAEGYHTVNMRVSASVNSALAGGWNLAVTIG